MPNRKISIVTSCYNEADNIPELYARVKAVMEKHSAYEWDFIFSDNYSTDGTRDVLRKLASEDPRVKVIFNARNYGHIRSPMNAFLQADGDAVVTMCSDLQDPPEMISDMIREWEKDTKVVIAVREKTECSFLIESFRRMYYATLKYMAPGEQLISRFTGYGLYDRKVVEAIRQYQDPYPYFRGLISEVGFTRTELPFVQPKRTRGKTKNNVFTLYDMAMTGFVNHTKLPLRLAVFCGTFLAIICLLVALGYLIAKLIWWDTFSLGIAPLVIGIFFLAAVQLLFIGVLGEYIGAIWTQVKHRPLVVEEERINF